MTTRRAPAYLQMPPAMMPMGPAPVMSTSSPMSGNISAVCVALPKASKKETTSSGRLSSMAMTLRAGMQTILCERAVTVNADADVVLAPLDIAGVAVAAVAAGDMALAGDALADREARDARAKLGDLADILMADDLWGLDVLLRPLVPFVDMDVGAADRGLVDLDENFSGARHRNRHLPQLQSGAGCGFYNGIHHLFHFKSALSSELHMSVLRGLHNEICTSYKDILTDIRTPVKGNLVRRI